MCGSFGSSADIYRSGDTVGPLFECVQLGFRKEGAFDAGYELGKRANIHADSHAAGSYGFDEGGATANMGIEHQVTGYSKRVYSSPCEGRTEPGGMLVEAVRQTFHGRNIAGAC